MIAIKLPVTAVPGELFWSVRDARGVDISVQQPESVAKQIALALNMHDALVTELYRLQDCVDEVDFKIISELLERVKP